MRKIFLIALLAGTGLLVTANLPLAAKNNNAVLETEIAQATGSQFAVTTLEGFAGTISALATSPDGETLLVATGDGKITAINLADSTEIYSKQVASKPTMLAVSNDNSYIAAAVNEQIVVFSPEDGSQTKTLNGHIGRVSSIAIGPDNKTLVSVSGSDRTIRLWDLQEGEEIKELGENVGAETTVAFSPDGSSFVTGSIGEDRTIKLWDTQTLELLKTSAKQPGYIYDVAITPDGQKIIAAVRNLVKVWDFVNGTELLSVKGATLDLNAIAISPDGRLVATANKEGTITLWDIATGRSMGMLSGHRGWVLSLVFSPDGKYLYSGAEDKLVKIWELSP
jgi:WD40 repeat protein